MDDARERDTLNETKAALLLDRAARLDAEGGTRVSVEELRQVALEAGISAESFERALAEIRESSSDVSRAVVRVDDASPRTDADRRPVSLVSSLIQRTGLFVTGSVLAFLSQTLMSDVGMDSEPVMIFTLVVAALIVAWSAVKRRRDREVFEFETDVSVLWVAMTFWIMLANPGDVGDVLEVMMPGGFLAALLGGIVVATGPSEPQPEQIPERV